MSSAGVAAARGSGLTQTWVRPYSSAPSKFLRKAWRPHVVTGDHPVSTEESPGATRLSKERTSPGPDRRERASVDLPEPLPGGARTRRVGRLSAPRAHTKALYKTDVLWETLRPLKRPRRTRTAKCLASAAPNVGAVAYGTPRRGRHSHSALPFAFFHRGSLYKNQRDKHNDSTALV
jgi:hypothetical protein